MGRLTPSLILSLVVVVPVGLAVACGGGGSDASPTLSPSPSGRPDLSPEVGGVEAAQRYLLESGIDEAKGGLTDPRSCAEISDSPEGEFCVHEDFSTYAPGLVILRVARADEPQSEVWEIRLLFRDEQWQVTEVKPFGESE
jgi:hypothetical protein